MEIDGCLFDLDTWVKNVICICIEMVMYGNKIYSYSYFGANKKYSMRESCKNLHTRKCPFLRLKSFSKQILAANYKFIQKYKQM